MAPLSFAPAAAHTYCPPQGGQSFGTQALKKTGLSCRSLLRNGEEFAYVERIQNFQELEECQVLEYSVPESDTRLSKAHRRIYGFNPKPQTLNPEP